MKLDLISNKSHVANGINPNDEFYTPEYAIYPIIKYLDISSVVWCPFDTEDSLFVKLLKLEGIVCFHSHLSSGSDFFKCDPPKGVTHIISNPPYSLKFEVFERLFSFDIPFAMLVGVVGLFESTKRFNLFKNNTFEIMYFDKRVSYFKSYEDKKPSLNPPFSSVYVCKNMLPHSIIFENLNKELK